MTINIRYADEKDIPEILSIQSELLIENKQNKENLEKEGFLVYPLDKPHLKSIILDKSNILLIALNNKQIVGYALSYDLGNWKKLKSNWENQIKIDKSTKEEINSKKVIYFRHIARRKGFKGIGWELEKKMFNIIKQRNYQLILAEILESPYTNTISKELHKQRGFEKIGEVDYKDGRLWGLYKKDIN
jgi:hypothetical protein